MTKKAAKPKTYKGYYFGPKETAPSTTKVVKPPSNKTIKKVIDWLEWQNYKKFHSKFG